MLTLSPSTDIDIQHQTVICEVDALSTQEACRARNTHL